MAVVKVAALCIALLTILGIAAFVLGPRFPAVLIFFLAGGAGVATYTLVEGKWPCTRVENKWPWLEGWIALAIGCLVYLLAYWVLEALAVKVMRVGLHVTFFW